MKLKLIAATAIALLFIFILAFAAFAQQQVPAPYAGLKNPFPWDDASAQQAGKKIYQQSCLGCHGAKGDNLAGSNFSTATYQDTLKNNPDLHFWLLTEGELDKGMPPFKSSLSDEQRWQVLTYIWSLGNPSPSPEVPPPSKPVTGAVLQLSVPKDAQAGQTLTLTAKLRDSDGKAIQNAPVKFFLNADFFSHGLMDIGEATTNIDGIANLETTLRESGEVNIVARYEATESSAKLTLTGAGGQFYHPEVGIRMPTIGSELFIGPVISEGLDEMGRAPSIAFILPGGTLSWLLLLVMAVILIWSTYFYVVYQVFHIGVIGGTPGGNTRLVPFWLLVLMATIGIFLVLKLITGPYSQF